MSGFSTARHHHPWNELVLCQAGFIRIEMEGESLLVEPGTAMWIPAGVEHAAASVRTSRVQLIEIQPGALTGMTSNAAAALATPRRFHASPLLLALIARCTSGLHQPAGMRQLIEPLILLEMLSARARTDTIALPTHKLLQRLCALVLQAPRIDVPLPALAKAVGSSTSTIHRLFQQELGCSFMQWRLRVILQHALALGRGGRPLAAIAQALGYAHPSALSAMISRQTGWPARQWLEREGAIRTESLSGSTGTPEPGMYRTRDPAPVRRGRRRTEGDG